MTTTQRIYLEPGQDEFWLYGPVKVKQAPVGVEVPGGYVVTDDQESDGSWYHEGDDVEGSIKKYQVHFDQEKGQFYYEKPLVKGARTCPDCQRELDLRKHKMDCYHLDCDEDDQAVHDCGYPEEA